MNQWRDRMRLQRDFVFLVMLAFLAVSCAPREDPSIQAITEDDVVAFVERAVDYARTNGKEKALEEFMNKGGEFFKGELYIFADSFEGIALSHGGNPELVGQDIMDITDKRGTKIMPEMLKVARQGSGWVEYYWTNPVSGKDERKLTYVKKVDEGWFVGAGMYSPKEK
jgi:cytochrome c